MAPYAIAHLKIGLKLYETGYRFGSHERVRGVSHQRPGIGAGCLTNSFRLRHPGAGRTKLRR